VVGGAVVGGGRLIVQNDSLAGPGAPADLNGGVIGGLGCGVGAAGCSCGNGKEKDDLRREILSKGLGMSDEGGKSREKDGWLPLPDVGEVGVGEGSGEGVCMPGMCDSLCSETGEEGERLLSNGAEGVGVREGGEAPA